MNCRILIADDHELIHIGISDILKPKEMYHVVGHSYNGMMTVEMALELIPDIIFMDISMPEMNGIEAIRNIKSRQPAIKIIALTQHEDKEYLLEVFRSGGDGYMLKNSRKEDFYNAIEMVLGGKKYISNDLSAHVLSSVLFEAEKGRLNKEVHLTRREKEIITKIAEAKSNIEIAGDLNISLRTVETHRRNLMQKLKVTSVVALIKYATANDLIEL